MNAFTGAKMYYSDADDSFTGILTGGGVNGQATSTLSQIGTGLSSSAAPPHLVVIPSASRPALMAHGLNSQLGHRA
jgi:hypothetical protein